MKKQILLCSDLPDLFPVGVKLPPFEKEFNHVLVRLHCELASEFGERLITNTGCTWLRFMDSSTLVFVVIAGDHSYKLQSELSAHEQQITAMPDVKQTQLTE